MTRSLVRAKVFGAHASPITHFLLIDSGAVRTAFSAVRPWVVEFVRDDGASVQVRGEFAGFTEPETVDLNILGRDVRDNFDLAVSWRRNEIFLLAPRRQYKFTSG